MAARFGHIFDGWNHASEHFIDVFACYEVDGVIKTPLLCMTLLQNTLDENLSAPGHYEFHVGMLPCNCGKHVTYCLFLVGDNCAVNQFLAARMGDPLVGCASRRLNRTVQTDMA
ncbi:hypothetical protein PR003_g28519 [Phytophthora rubi]|uniref:Uncharacterized protein n=1 Tax=Phytophthora rubi TaxID=129364 RepID=A0A6A3H1J2_9STRA|nr:hypothetical protein PR001_g29378 [Phytophthora rubi]KAE9278456.1 hypothetical protein PR003_g28519 [Phytophthora rubi]